LVEDYAVYPKVLVRDERIVEDNLTRRRKRKPRVGGAGRAPSSLISPKEELFICKEVFSYRGQSFTQAGEG
jgi:hypothetical protein